MTSTVPKPGPANMRPGAGLDEWLEEAKRCHYLPEAVMKQLCEMVKEVLMEESNIQPVVTPVVICGDIHGQFYDLLELFRVAGGMPGETSVQAPQTATTVITSEDLEPPTEITDPKLRKRIRSSSAGGATEEGGGDSADQSAQPADDTLEKSTASPSPAADTRFVFLGDFVDRGYFSLETFTLLMCLKAKYPDRIVLVRGNHESRQITQVYGFYEECQQKYGNASVWKACCQVFDFLVLAAIVDGSVLCVHGGLSPEIRTIDQIRVVARAQEIPHEGAFCDLVWSDPEDIDTWAVSPRGAGWLFGDKVATEFNHVNRLQTIARAHQLVNEGYKYHFAQKSVVTVWSAPNYCYRCGNVASIMAVDRDLNTKFSIFSAVPDEQRHVPAGRGSGFIAAHTLDQLLEKGYKVITTVRSEEKAKIIRDAHPNVGKDALDIAIVPDIAKPDAFDEVVKTPGVELVLHTASPFHFNIGDPKDLIDPAVIGTTGILKAIARSAPSVKRVVITSSFAAILDPERGTDPNTLFNESSWNPITLEKAVSNPNDKPNAYRASKKLAEEAAWAFVRDPASGVKFDLVTINPPMVFGPVVPYFANLESVNTSNERIVNLLRGKWREDNAIPDTGLAFIWIDVRDVAEAHIRAMEVPEAGGKRLFTTAGTFSNREIYEVTKKHFGDKYADKLPPNDVKGGEILPEDKRYRFDNSETNKILGITWRTLEESIVDAIKCFQTAGV
ncbi:hypothetical protein PpBr36_04380 [Pyricularia pennisetigena]|uniref:hypothetical protein n=1 Tax=Pyricularia pennisetigena TaxID=1578925 RepID=UPI001151D008|nr:hypothetical protein PpBr36_04380 [Pyricularia pennisetigena]TLS27113.1 hypothetical protein PpBr36_04380 [Pyricularia pennisetigena]